MQLFFFVVAVWVAIKLLALRRRGVSTAAAEGETSVSRAHRMAVAGLRRAITVLVVAAVIYLMLMRCFLYLIAQ